MPATLWAPRLSAMTMSPGCRVGTKIWSMSARKLSPSIAPSKTPGAVSPVTRHAARNVLVCQRPQGAWAWTRAPRGARPYRRSRVVVLPVSSRNTRWATSQVGAAACHATRAAATSGRSCSDGRTVLFHGQAEGPARRARPSAHARAWRGRPSAQPACDPGAPPAARPRCVGAAQACRAVQVAGREAPPRPCRAAAVSRAAPTTRSRGTSPPHRPPSSRPRCRVAPALADPSNRHASVLLHRCAQKYHDRPR